MAFKKLGGGNITEVKKEHENGRVAYELKADHNNETYEMVIFADTGEFHEFKKDGRRDDEPVPAVSMQKAERIALAEVGAKGEIVEAKLDAGSQKYEVTILAGGIEYEIVINAATGAVIEKKR